MHDVQAIADVVRRHDALLVVDAVSGLGAARLEQDAWGVDVVVAGSQKALMTPPGLAFASVSERALAAPQANGGGRYYFDWGRTAKSQAKGASPFTPAVSLFLGLDVALGMIEEEGLENVWARHDLLARATRAGALALGLDLYGDPDERSTVVTAIELPGDIDGGKVPGTLRKLGITANGGQDDLKGRILRIAHCGYFGAFDILTSLSGLEMALAAARPRRRPRRRRRRRAAGLPRGRRPRGGVSLLGEQQRVLVAEKIADSGVDLLRERFAVDVGDGVVGGGAGGPDRRLPRDPDPVGDAVDGGSDRARRQPAGDRPGGDRGRQRRRRRRRRSGGSSSPTRRSRTSWRRRSTRSR